VKNRLSLFSRLFECSAFAQEKKENYKSKEEKSFSYFLSFSFSILIFIFVSATFYSILSLFAFVCYWRSVEKWVTKKNFFCFCPIRRLKSNRKFAQQPKIWIFFSCSVPNSAEERKRLWRKLMAGDKSNVAFFFFFSFFLSFFFC
jgi:hypothetical protein